MIVGRGVGRGLAAALWAAVVVRGRAFDALLVPPTSVPPHLRRAAVDPSAVARPTHTRAAHTATRMAFAALRVLQRFPGWRNTCLYRAIAECLVLRGLGLPAIVRLGVARADTGAVTAHAWVECAGYRCRTIAGDEAETFAPLRRATTDSAADVVAREAFA